MSSSENLVANTPSADVTPPVDVVLPTVDAVNVKAESSTPSKQDTAPLPTATQQYQPLLPRTTPVSIRPLPTLSPYGLSPTNGGVPLSNYSARMYRPPVIPSKEDQSKGRKGRRKRTTPYQLAELMKVFQTNESPGHELREDLTGKVGMTNREVQVWFQNRRAKEANRAKRVEQVDANRPGLTGYRKMSSTSSNSDMSSDTAGSSECISSLSSSTSTTTLVNSETSGTVKTTSTQQHHHRPIKMAPRKNSFSTVSPSALYSSPFGRMAMAFAAPDGRIMFLQPPEPTPSTSQQPLPSQQQQQQQQNNSPCPQQPFQFLPSPTFFSSQSNFTTQPQVMLVPVLMPTGSYPLNALSGPVVHRGLKSGTDVVPRSVSFPETKTGGGEKRRTEVGTVEAEKEKYAEAANVLASLATA